MDTPPKKSMGQHWLKDKQSLEAICDAAGVKVGDYVLEIGPGTGELTEALLRRGAKVTALEYDDSLLPKLKKRFKESDKFNLEHGDIRSFNFTTMPAGYKIVANIPYYLSANILRLLNDTDRKPERAALLVQKEVAQRVAAGPGQMAFVSVCTQFFYEVHLGWEVPARLFTPPPKVDSQVLILHKRLKPLYDVDQKQFFRLVKAGFAAKRKTLHNSLSATLRADKTTTRQQIEQSDIDPGVRAQELSLLNWYKLYHELKP